MEDPFSPEDEDRIAIEHMAGVMATFYKAFKKAGLPSQEAAALTAACMAQNMPQDLEGPRDGS